MCFVFEPYVLEGGPNKTIAFNDPAKIAKQVKILNEYLSCNAPNVRDYITPELYDENHWMG